MLLRATPEQTWCSGGFLADQWQATSLRDETRWVHADAAACAAASHVGAAMRPGALNKSDLSAARPRSSYASDRLLTLLRRGMPPRRLREYRFFKS